MKKTGIESFLQMLVDAEVRYIFGNPGTTELPLCDAMAPGGNYSERIQYILGLHEVAVMGMADGYAMARGDLGVVNLHISCGLGNAMGMLYNAHREGTPLLVTVGQQDRRLRFEEPILGSDMVRVARPWTKWAAEVERIEDLPSAVRRAMQQALTPPTGPVFLSIPLDIQLERAELDLTPSPRLDTRVRPPVEALWQAADLLSAAENPAILVGSRVTESDAIDELVAVAEHLGAPAISESGTTHGRLGFPADHPLSVPGLPLWSPQVRERLKPYDVLLVVGMDVLRQYVYHEPSRPIPEHLQVIHFDHDAYQLGKNYPIRVGVWGDIKAGLSELATMLTERATPHHEQLAAQRRQRLAEQQAAMRKKLLDAAAAERDERPMTPLVLMESLARVLPENVAVVEEAVTTTNTMFERLGVLKNPKGYFGTRGWALGWGLGTAIGVQMAWPDRPVLAMLGDGAAMYGIQGLWSAAHYNIPVTFVICNNAQYQILKIGAASMGLPQAQAGNFLGLDTLQPEIDFVALAESLGVRASRVTEPEELSALAAESLAGDEPRLIDVAITRETPGRLNYG